MKSWLITSSAPFCGTDSHYGAYAEEEPTDWLYEHWFDEECQRLWDSYSFHCEDQWQDEWDEMDEDGKEEVFDNNYDNFMDNKYEEWCADWGLKVEECDEEDFDLYVPGGEGELEIIYDERSK